MPTSKDLVTIAEDRTLLTMDSSSAVCREFPDIIPCCYGREVGVDTEIIRTGLSAIAIKRQKRKKTSTTDKPGTQLRPSSFENRNSFFNLHRPEMTKINWVSTSPKKIEQFFHDHSTKHGPFCAYLHDIVTTKEDELKCILPVSDYKYNEDEFVGISGSIGNSVLLKTISMQLSDEDLSPSNICHRSRAEFCMTIGGKEVPRFNHTMSQTMTDTLESNAKGEEHNRSGSLPKENENLLSPIPGQKTDVKRIPSPVDNTAMDVYHKESTELASIIPGDESLPETKITRGKPSLMSALSDCPSFREILQPQAENSELSVLNKVERVEDVMITRNQVATVETARSSGTGCFKRATTTKAKPKLGKQK